MYRTNKEYELDDEKAAKWIRAGLCREADAKPQGKTASNPPKGKTADAKPKRSTRKQGE